MDRLLNNSNNLKSIGWKTDSLNYIQWIGQEKKDVSLMTTLAFEHWKQFNRRKKNRKTNDQN